MSVKVSAQYDSQLIRGDGSDRYLLVTIRGESEGTPSTSRVPLNLSLILDRSGSMASEDKLKLVKQAAAFIIERLSENDRVSVVAYDEQIQTIAHSTKASAQARQEIAGRINQLTTGGSTNLGEGWLTGCREIAEFQTEARYVDCAWLLTDGLANVGIISQEDLTTHATELRKRGISTTTFGVGLDFNEDLLRAMAEKGGGHFYFIENSRQIKNYFEGELGERLNTVARNVTLQVQLPAEVGLENLNDYEVARQGMGRYSLNLGDIYAGEEREVLIKLTIPAGKVGTQVKPAALVKFTTARSGEGRELRVSNDGNDLTLLYATDPECDAQVVDARLAELISKLLAARTKQEILEANKRGDYATARAGTSRLTDLLTKAFGVASPAAYNTSNEVAEVETLSQQASMAPLAPAARKQTHYDSHNQLRSRSDYKK